MNTLQFPINKRQRMLVRKLELDREILLSALQVILKHQTLTGGAKIQASRAIAAAQITIVEP